MLGVELACSLDNRRVALFRMFCELTHRVRRDLLCLFRRDSGLGTGQRAFQASQQTSRQCGRSCGCDQMIQNSGALPAIGLSKQLRDHLRERRGAL
jgi:hypothetical protein